MKRINVINLLGAIIFCLFTADPAFSIRLEKEEEIGITKEDKILMPENKREGTSENPNISNFEKETEMKPPESKKEETLVNSNGSNIENQNREEQNKTRISETITEPKIANKTMGEDSNKPLNIMSLNPLQRVQTWIYVAIFLLIFKIVLKSKITRIQNNCRHDDIELIKKEIMGNVYKHQRKDGGRDERYRDNPLATVVKSTYKCPVCRYLDTNYSEHYDDLR